MSMFGRTFTGAWIETCLLKNTCAKIAVAPLQVRGLKRRSTRVVRAAIRRTFTGAWIETDIVIELKKRNWSRTFTGAWIETTSYLATLFINLSHLYRCTLSNMSRMVRIGRSMETICLIGFLNRCVAMEQRVCWLLHFGRTGSSILCILSLKAF